MMKKLLLKLLGEKTAKLANGQTVKHGDLVEFTDSDGEVRQYYIERNDRTGKLYFCNCTFPVDAYKSARLVN